MDDDCWVYVKADACLFRSVASCQMMSRGGWYLGIVLLFLFKPFFQLGNDVVTCIAFERQSSNIICHVPWENVFPFLFAV